MRCYGRILRVLGGGAAWLLVPPAMAQGQAAPAPPVAEEPQSPEEAEFIRVVEAIQARQEANDPAGAAALMTKMVTLGERVMGLTNADFLDLLAVQAEYLASFEMRGEVLHIVKRLHAGRVAALGADDPKAVEALIYLATAHSSSGDYPSAEPLMAEAVQRAERVLGAQHEQTLLAINNLGVLRLEQGRLAEAETLLQRSLTGRERVLGNDHDETMDSLSALATLYRTQQRYEEAEPLMRRALATRERVNGAEFPSTIYAMNNLGVLLNLSGAHGEAEALFSRAEKAAAGLGPDHPHLVDARDGRAVAMLMTARLKEAEPIAREALAARERIQGPDHPATVRATSILANIYLLTDRPALAEPLLLRALTQSERRLGSDHADTLLSLENVVYARLLGPAPATAMEAARQLVAGEGRRRFGGGDDVYSQLQTGRAAQGRSPGRRYTMFADAAYGVAQQSPGGQGSPELLAEVLIVLQQAMSGEASASIGRMAVRRYLENRGGDLAALVRDREGLTDQWKMLSDRIAQSFNNDEASAGQERELLRAERVKLEARMTSIDARIRKDFPDYFDLVRPQPLQGPQAQGLLGPDEAVLIAVPGPFGTHVMALSKDQAVWARAPLKESDIEEVVNRLRYDAGAAVNASPEQLRSWQADRPAGDQPSFDRVSAYGLYRVLFERAEQVLKGKKRVYVVAAGSLAGLPFSMLVTHKPEGADDDPAALRATQWLADRHALVHIPSLYSLAFLRGPAGAPATGGFIGFGDPSLTGQAATRGARRGAAIPASHEVITSARTPSGGAMANVAALRQMQQLPGTALELKEMAGIFGASSQVFTRARATEAQVRSTDLSQARVIAFATHGLTPADPVGEAQASELYELAEPGLVLTPPAQASAQDDGFLSASEVASLRLNADWVILSACNTATGDAATAGLSQLARAFFYAGARSLLASHWPVDDEVAAKMTVRTLALEQAGTPRAEAFQQAMREIRTDPAHANWAHPFYWSPFVLIGDGGK